MYRFRATIHARTSTTGTGEQASVSGCTVRKLDVALGDVTPLAVSFEEAVHALDVLPRMLIEPDGSFVWRSGDPGDAWQIDGVLYDRAGKLIYVEVSGSCPQAEFDQLLAACGWPSTPLMFQLVQHAIFVSEEDFRQVAERNEANG